MFLYISYMMSMRISTTGPYLQPNILFQQDVHLFRRKNLEPGLVDRGVVNMKVIRDTTEQSFRFVGEFLLSLFQS